MMPSLRLYDFLVRFNSPSNVRVFLWIVAIIHVLAVSLCMARAVLDNPNGWPWAVLFLNLFNLIVLTIDARSYGLSNPLMAFLVIVSESMCLAANIIICFMGTFYMRGVSIMVLFFSFLQKTCVVAYILSTLIRAVSKNDVPPTKTYARFASHGNDSDGDSDASGGEQGDYNLH